MAYTLNVVLGYIICFSFISSVLTDTDECVQKSPCKCEFANGTGIDLTPSIRPEFYEARTFSNESSSNFAMTIFYFHPCEDIKAPVNTTGSTGNLSVYKTVQELKKDNKTENAYVYTIHSESLGNTAASNFSKDGRSIKFSNKPSMTTISLICAQTTDKLLAPFIDEQEPNSLVLEFYSPNACIKLIEDVSHRSFGSTLLIIFFSCVIFYLVLGILTKKFLMGATGIEVIPNLGFWTDLPGLCKDGWIFMRNGFKVLPRDRPATGQDPNSYDSI